MFIAATEHIDALERDPIFLSEIRYPLTGQVALIDLQIAIYLRWNVVVNRLVGGRRSTIKQRKKLEDVMRPRSPLELLLTKV